MTLAQWLAPACFPRLALALLLCCELAGSVPNAVHLCWQVEHLVKAPTCISMPASTLTSKLVVAQAGGVPMVAVRIQILVSGV
jgi:hypothetical protein